MADADLEEIRRARLAQLREQGGQGSGSGETDEAESRRQAEQEQRSSLLAQILHPSALDRLNRIRLVKASRAEDVENRLIALARSGQLRQKVDEGQLKDMLSRLSEMEEERGGSGGVGRIVVQRRGGGWDVDEDEELEGLMGEK